MTAIVVADLNFWRGIDRDGKMIILDSNLVLVKGIWTPPQRTGIRNATGTANTRQG